MFEIKVEKPQTILKKIQPQNLNINVKDLFVSLIKAGISSVFFNWEGLGKSGIDLSTAIGINSQPGEVAYLLIARSFVRAIDILLEDNKNLLTREPDGKDLKSILFDRFNSCLEDNQVIIDHNFFQQPRDLPIVKKLQTSFSQWLKNFIQEENDIENIKNCFPSYFVFALSEQWRSQDYNCLIEKLNIPFDSAEKRALGWFHYNAWLQKTVEKPVFTESFSLKKIYVDLRAHYKVEEENKIENKRNRSDHTQEKRYKKFVVDLHEELETWLRTADSNDAIRLLTGGPGSGKSSFAKMFAAKRAEKWDIPVLYIPLHQLEFSKDLIEAVKKFVEFNSYLTENPLDSRNRDLRLLIIFDGLDELSMQGKIAAETARNFVEQVLRKVELFNQVKTRLQVLITGREVVIEANKSQFYNPQQLLYLLPYFVSESERIEYIDENNLLMVDQRQDWWQNYGKIKGIHCNQMPSELDRNNLTEITAQPFFNYLVALAFDDSFNDNDENKKFKFTENTKLNEIYQYLLDRVYQRDYENQGNRLIRGISKEDFISILQEMAISCWHGNSRSTTVQEIENKCYDSGLENVFQHFQDNFQEDSKASVTRLLTAFYFRESEQLRGSEKTFEFTHKSFSEYLTAKRIVEELKYIHEDLEEREKNRRKGHDEHEALIKWANLCGNTAIDKYVFRFILDEISLIYEKDIELVRNWQKTLCRLIKEIMSNGMPMEDLKHRPNFKEEMRQSRNAEEALLVLLYVCARNTRKISNINWGSLDAFGTWISRLQGQRKEFENALALECLSFLNLENSILIKGDFFGADLCGADLSNAILRSADLRAANLTDTNLSNAILSDADLCRADLNGANLSHADVRGADLSRADLSNANLCDADFNHANLSSVNLSGAYLIKVNITPSQIQFTSHWDNAFYKGYWDDNQSKWIIDEQANQKYIEQLKQSIA